MVFGFGIWTHPVSRTDVDRVFWRGLGWYAELRHNLAVIGLWPFWGWTKKRRSEEVEVVEGAVT